MKICHVCKKEWEDETEICPVCGADLTNVPQEKPQEESDIMVNPTLLTSFEDIISAEIFMDILTDNEIPFASSSQMGESALQVTFGGGLVSEDIYVAEADLEKARELYEEFLNSDSEFQNEFFDDIEDEV